MNHPGGNFRLVVAAGKQATQGFIATLYPLVENTLTGTEYVLFVDIYSVVFEWISLLFQQELVLRKLQFAEAFRTFGRPQRTGAFAIRALVGRAGLSIRRQRYRYPRTKHTPCP